MAASQLLEGVGFLQQSLFFNTKLASLFLLSYMEQENNFLTQNSNNEITAPYFIVSIAWRKTNDEACF